METSQEKLSILCFLSFLQQTRCKQFIPGLYIRNISIFNKSSSEYLNSFPNYIYIFFFPDQRWHTNTKCYRVTQWLRQEASSRDHLVQALCSEPSLTTSALFRVSRASSLSTTSLGNLFPCLAALGVKVFFLFLRHIYLNANRNRVEICTNLISFSLKTQQEPHSA